MAELINSYMSYKLNVKHINGGKMKRKTAIYLTFSLIMLLVISNCKEELIVESKNERIQTSQSILAKTNISASIISDSLSKKEKIAKLKKEHEKPYMVIDKPDRLLADILKSRSSKKTLSKSLNISNFTQSSQSCSTIEMDVWVFSKYEARSTKEFGIWPHDSRMYAGSSGDPNRIRKLNELKSKWGFNYIAASIGDGANIGAIVSAG